MKAPVVALKQPGNHGPHAGSICQKICPQRPKPGKYDYFAQPESYSRSGAWEFFTENYIETYGNGRGYSATGECGCDLTRVRKTGPSAYRLSTICRCNDAPAPQPS